MTDVEEGGSIKCGSERAILCIAWDQASEPVVSDANRRENSSLAAIFETRFAENSKLSDSSDRSDISIGSGEDLSLVQENNLDSFNDSLMNTQLVNCVELYLDCINKFDTCWVLCEISSQSLSVSFVVWGNHDDFLSQFCQAYRKLINHDSKTAYCGPSTKFWTAEHNWSKIVELVDGLSCSLNWIWL